MSNPFLEYLKHDKLTRPTFNNFYQNSDINNYDRIMKYSNHDYFASSKLSELVSSKCSDEVLFGYLSTHSHKPVGASILLLGSNSSLNQIILRRDISLICDNVVSLLLRMGKHEAIPDFISCGWKKTSAFATNFIVDYTRAATLRGESVRTDQYPLKWFVDN